MLSYKTCLKYANMGFTLICYDPSQTGDRNFVVAVYNPDGKLITSGPITVDTYEWLLDRDMSNVQPA